MCSRICKHNYRITIIVKIGYHDHSPAGLVVTGVPLARDDMHSPRATVKHTPCFSTPTGDTSSFSNFRYTLSSSGMSKSTSSNISNSQIKKSQSWRTLVININSAPGKREELENLINYTDPDLIIMTETKIDEQVKASEFLPKLRLYWRY